MYSYHDSEKHLYIQMEYEALKIWRFNRIEEILDISERDPDVVMDREWSHVLYDHLKDWQVEQLCLGPITVLYCDIVQEEDFAHRVGRLAKACGLADVISIVKEDGSKEYI